MDKKNKKFEFLDHTADLEFVSFGETLNEVFENSALAFFTATLSIDSIEIKEISQSRKYLNLCLENTTKYSPMAAVFILQHKVDLIPTKMREEVYHTIKDYLFKDIRQHLWYYETSMVNSSIIVAICAVYHATLGYIPNNVIPDALSL